MAEQKDKGQLLRELDKKMIEGHEYDGIRELDNDLPPWWLWLFYVTIGWSLVYVVVYHFTGSLPLQDEEYTQEVANAPKRAVQANVDTTMAMTEASAIEAGKEIYKKECVTCHLAEAQGLVGPNLTDNYWIHGNTIADMLKVVSDGVVEKGMLPYKSKLSLEQRMQVISYVVTLKGTNPPNPKEPQGTEYK